MTASPAEVARQFWAARQRGDRQATEALLAPNLQWQVMGRNHACARTYHGPSGFLDELGGLLGAGLLPGTRTLQVTNVVADGDQAVVELHESADARNGHHLVLDVIAVMTVQEGRITHCREYLDLAEVGAALP